ncbi:uncharacterized protein LOC133904555 [Phragmites australis]|uniref:uncharacterized protein LOC133904555 n=1 Tax=Phragmites australis TaxID=29695 RepID=UPI002D79C7DB|nr:uncharacterized protein LOC133904555 [Phragmites australis]
MLACPQAEVGAATEVNVFPDGISPNDVDDFPTNLRFAHARSIRWRMDVQSSDSSAIAESCRKRRAHVLGSLERAKEYRAKPICLSKMLIQSSYWNVTKPSRDTVACNHDEDSTPLSCAISPPSGGYRPIYTIEFQKRGLPPRPSHSVFMIHGPCGAANPTCSCMVDGQCSKYYPKEYCDKTTMLQNGYVRYARLKNGLTTKKNGIDIDNQFVVPHNVDLLVKYQAHINVERVNRDGLEKYMFKYFSKGFYCSKVGLSRRRSSVESSVPVIDEIRDYLECKCVTPNDADWCLLQFDIHHTGHAVERLHCPLPFENSIVFTEDDNLEQVVENPRNAVTKLTAWYEANKTFPNVIQFTYTKFFEHFTWYGDGKYWDLCRGSYKIGRVANVGPNQGESYYLHRLLHVVKGVKSYVDIRTIESHQYPTFQAACQALGLLGDDHEWSFDMADASR